MSRRIKGFTEHLVRRATARPAEAPAPPPEPAVDSVAEPAPKAKNEQGGPKGPEPTRYGDWEAKGRCIDF
jgi:hypothetical protein